MNKERIGWTIFFLILGVCFAIPGSEAGLYAAGFWFSIALLNLVA